MSDYLTRAYGERTGNVGTLPAPVKPLGYQQITATSSAVGLTPPAGAIYARIVPEAQAVRWRDDGTSPTASVGMLWAVGTEYVYSGSLSSVRFIAATAGAILNVSYYG